MFTSFKYNWCSHPQKELTKGNRDWDNTHQNQSWCSCMWIKSYRRNFPLLKPFWRTMMIFQIKSKEISDDSKAFTHLINFYFFHSLLLLIDSKLHLQAFILISFTYSLFLKKDKFEAVDRLLFTVSDFTGMQENSSWYALLIFILFLMWKHISNHCVSYNCRQTLSNVLTKTNDFLQKIALDPIQTGLPNAV